MFNGPSHEVALVSLVDTIVIAKNVWEVRAFGAGVGATAETRCENKNVQMSIASEKNSIPGACCLRQWRRGGSKAIGSSWNIDITKQIKGGPNNAACSLFLTEGFSEFGKIIRISLASTDKKEGSGQTKSKMHSKCWKSNVTWYVSWATQKAAMSKY